MIKLYVFSRAMVEGIKQFKDDALIISIVSPGQEHPKLEGEHIYKFHFRDVTESFEMGDGRVINPIEKESAEAIAEIAIAHRDKKVWVIHCEAGISRSPGVAIGLSRYIETDPDTHKLITMYPCYNKYVRKLIERAMREKIKEITEEINKQSGCAGEE